jgi:dUTP pyrophosphatase
MATRKTKTDETVIAEPVETLSTVHDGEIDLVANEAPPLYIEQKASPAITKSSTTTNTQPVVEVEMLRGEFYLEHATDGSSGFDVRACIDEPIKLVRGGRSVLIPTGFKMHIGNPNITALIVPRSGNGHKRGLVMGNTIAVIDSDYQGEWFISAWARPNRATHEPTNPKDFENEDGAHFITINPGDRIAQILFVPVIHPVFSVVDKLSTETERGSGGFSSTGIK